MYALMYFLLNILAIFESCNAIDLMFFMLFHNIGGLGFWLVGYGLAFGEGNNGIIGTSFFASVGLPFNLYSHLFFQVRQYHGTNNVLTYLEL